MPRTAGFNSIDVGAMGDATLLGTVILMFIGGGSAGTAGGIKVTTFVILLFVIIAEVRGERSASRPSTAGIDPRVQRQALTVALLGVAAVVGTSLAVMLMSPFTLTDGAVRGHLGVRDRRAVDRHHRRAARGRAGSCSPC